MSLPNDGGGQAVSPTVAELLQMAADRYPGTPYLALGQTVFWDEPTKAVWRRLLDRHSPQSLLIAGVHDTDYFAKLSNQVQNDDKFAIVPHDDGATRDLWSAAGELSALMGSESIPTRQMFLENGVPFDWLTKGGPAGEKASRYAGLTSAWGWRGLVRTDGQNVVTADIPVNEAAGFLNSLLDWGFDESLKCIEGGPSRLAADAVVAAIRGWIDDFAKSCSETCCLGDLYEWLLPRFYSLLLGADPAHFDTTASTKLFRFNTNSATLPRFAVLNVFLSPGTRETARTAYNSAVAGSGIYPLDSFGAGAIPFDLVIPGRGRGTIFLRSGKVIVQITPDMSVEIADGNIASALDLAVAVERRLGPDTALVGKAVILADMISAEHLVVFHESASGYTSITGAFNDRLAKAGVTLCLHPIVRLSYPTWDALARVPESVTLRLPDHIAAAFGTETITARDFAETWRTVVESQRTLLSQSRSQHKLRDLLTFLDAHERDRRTVAGFRSLAPTALETPQELPRAQRPPSLGGERLIAHISPAKEADRWCDLLADYESSLRFLRENAERSSVLRASIDQYRHELSQLRSERHALETRMGEDWRATVMPLMEELNGGSLSGDGRIDLQLRIHRRITVRARTFDQPLLELKKRIASCKILLSALRRERRLLERSPEALRARETVARITREAQAARLMFVRNAYLTVEGLTHTHVRPTAWWLPLVDPSGQWFEGMVAGTSARFEYIWPETL